MHSVNIIKFSIKIRIESIFSQIFSTDFDAIISEKHKPFSVFSNLVKIISPKWVLFYFRKCLQTAVIYNMLRIPLSSPEFWNKFENQIEYRPAFSKSRPIFVIWLWKRRKYRVLTKIIKQWFCTKSFVGSIWLCENFASTEYRFFPVQIWILVLGLFRISRKTKILSHCLCHVVRSYFVMSCRQSFSLLSRVHRVSSINCFVHENFSTIKTLSILP
jgi:hypothetical protein